MFLHRLRRDLTELVLHGFSHADGVHGDACGHRTLRSAAGPGRFLQAVKVEPETPPTSFFGLLSELSDGVLRAAVCENQSDPGDVAAGWSSAFGL